MHEIKGAARVYLQHDRSYKAAWSGSGPPRRSTVVGSSSRAICVCTLQTFLEAPSRVREWRERSVEFLNGRKRGMQGSLRPCSARVQAVVGTRPAAVTAGAKRAAGESGGLSKLEADRSRALAPAGWARLLPVLRRW
jgi:hypothetical protein